MHVYNVNWSIGVISFVKLLLSVVFLLAALGKLVDLETTAQLMHHAFHLPLALARGMGIALSVVELGVAALLWRRAPYSLLGLPVAFAATLLITHVQGLDCGCFGALPLLDQFSLEGHIFLLMGLFLGLLFLSNAERREKAPVGLGVSATALMLLAFSTLLFQQAPGPVDAADFEIIDRQAVEAALTDSSITFLDARMAFQYKAGHIPGALNLPFDSEEWTRLAQYSPAQDRFIVYCSSVSCNAAEVLAQALRDAGFLHLQIYAGGWEDWTTSPDQDFPFVLHPSEDS